MYYSGLAVLIVFTLGLLVSAITGFNKIENIDQKLYFDYKKKLPWLLMSKKSKIVPTKEENDVKIKNEMFLNFFS